MTLKCKKNGTAEHKFSPNQFSTASAPMHFYKVHPGYSSHIISFDKRSSSFSLQLSFFYPLRTRHTVAYLFVTDIKISSFIKAYECMNCTRILIHVRMWCALLCTCVCIFLSGRTHQQNHTSKDMLWCNSNVNWCEIMCPLARSPPIRKNAASARRDYRAMWLRRAISWESFSRPTCNQRERERDWKEATLVTLHLMHFGACKNPSRAII